MEQSCDIKELRAAVEEEIKNHQEWCSPECQTFLPDAYRKARIVYGDSAEKVQRDYDLCHVWR